MFFSKIRVMAGLLALSAASHSGALAQDQKSDAPAEKSAEAAAAESIDSAIDFAKEVTADATAAFSAEGATEAEKLKGFEDVLSEALALKTIGKFMLGESRKTMTEDQLARYDAIFPAYITRQYADQFAEIVGRPLEVTDAKKIGRRDVIVRTQFTRTDGSPVPVDWRVRKLKSGDQKMIDIIVNGVSIMLVKREEFSSFIANNSVDALLTQLETEARAA
ncbi:MAG: ABC transporter substrate-binding protein [Pseudomonadota bacterium]